MLQPHRCFSIVVLIISHVPMHFNLCVFSGHEFSGDLPLIQPLYLCLRRIFFKKGKKSLTIRQERGNIFKQSANTASNLRSWMDGTNRICEGGGTGRRARLRCVWFILGGSNPLPRTRRYPRNVDEESMLRGFFVICVCRILPDTARYCLLLPGTL